VLGRVVDVLGRPIDGKAHRRAALGDPPQAPQFSDINPQTEFLETASRSSTC
jgi:flagellar biosynthesis/type III secretory pathway ATPase